MADGVPGRVPAAHVATASMDPLFVRACLGQAVERTPVWIMRQAGRYLPEYRALRDRVDFLTSCRTPEIACELTLQPVTRLGVDAAILFSDILIPLPGMGVPVAFTPGPHLDAPVRTAADLARLRAPDPEESTGFVLEAIRLLRRALPPDVPLIGFAGAPFTLATYLVEGGATKSFSRIKGLLFGNPGLAAALLSICADTTAAYAGAQVRAGAQALMLFDTWAGILSPQDFAARAAPYVRRVFDAVAAAATGLAAPVPRLYYAGNAAGFLDQCRHLKADVIGIDWRLDLADARRCLGPGLALQGNLDPAVLLGPTSLIRDRAHAVLAAGRARPTDTVGAGPDGGHIFNLGHGILPETPPDHARALVDAVREFSLRRS
jgi:uroporphyrinogen decarboxylase